MYIKFFGIDATIGKSLSSVNELLAITSLSTKGFDLNPFVNAFAYLWFM